MTDVNNDNILCVSSNYDAAEEQLPFVSSVVSIVGSLVSQTERDVSIDPFHKKTSMSLNERNLISGLMFTKLINKLHLWMEFSYLYNCSSRSPRLLAMHSLVCMKFRRLSCYVAPPASTSTGQYHTAGVYHAEQVSVDETVG